MGHEHGPWPCQDSGCPEWAKLSGPERVRLAIRRDRGEFAPSGPVTLCGVPDGTELRADAPAWRWRLRRVVLRLRGRA